MSDMRAGNGAAMMARMPSAQSSNANSLVATSTVSSHETIDHTAELSANFGSLLLSPELSDVSFRIEDEELPVHRVLLAARSEYFRAMFYGGMREGHEQLIDLHETPLQAFKELLKYMYTGRLSLSGAREELILDLLGLAHKCAFTALQEAIADHLKATLSTRNVCTVFNVSQLYSLSSLTQHCYLYADRNASGILASAAFASLSAASVEELISRDSFCAPEIDIFKAIHRWSKEHPEESDECLVSLVSRLRLPLISLNELLHVVRPSGLLASDAILDAIKEQNETTSANLTHRGFLATNVNVATPSTASVIVGECPSALLTPDISSIQDGDRVFTRHSIDDSGEGIVVELASPYIINKIVLTLWDREPRMYSYYVEVSMDRSAWVRLVDHSRFLCRTKQTLLFRERAVKYIRVVGTHSSVNRLFHLVGLEAMYTTEEFEVDQTTGLIIPSSNVATIERNALVIEGVSRSRHSLVDGNTIGYDWDNGYTCHQLGSGSITVQLPQPFLISSMRLLLWDCDERCYSYYIEVSVNQQTWKRIVDRTNQDCKAWQLAQFPPEPVVFIRIVGTKNSANEVFHCVHLECPANSLTLPDQGDSSAEEATA